MILAKCVLNNKTCLDCLKSFQILLNLKVVIDSHLLGDSFLFSSVLGVNGQERQESGCCSTILLETGVLSITVHSLRQSSYNITPLDTGVL